jgi:hydrogenase maturation protein HypF
VPHVHIHITGIVQGVGYRPFVWRAATAAGVAGWVKNTADGLHIEAKGSQAALDAFVLVLSTQQPAAARVGSVHVDRIADEHIAAPGDAAELQVSGRVGASDFRIVESDAATDRSTLVSPDIATCPDCLNELLDPANRRYHYPFINCTNCGPRFTIIEDLPYDRPSTAMAGFAMCPTCAREYANPADRRFHAQPDACFACGPHLSWRTAAEPGRVVWGRDRATSDAVIEEAAQLLLEGGIVAVKGLGGFHLACDATNEEAVRRLRERKRRPSKPLAVMFARSDEVRKAAETCELERTQLAGPRRPVVLLRRKPEDEVPEQLRVAPSVAGTLPELGCMLPSTPVQHLLLRAVGRPLVMTSGNLSDEPIVCDDQLAVARLMDVADAWLGNDRAVLARYDDSVVRVVGEHVQTVRRARGIAPTPVKLPNPYGEDSALVPPEVLACGPEQKATFCLARGDEGFVSQHVGDLENVEAFDAWQAALADYRRLFGLEPAVLACDLHPEYLSSKWAREEAARTGLPLVEVQHHHAHLAAVLGENDVAEKVVGLALDGTGYGPDATLWGCEVLVCDQAGYDRAAHLATWKLPGGAVAVRKPVRCAYALLDAYGLANGELGRKLYDAMGFEGPVVRQMLDRDLNCPRTGSAGRLFDAVAALLGVCLEAGYEGEPACLLEALADGAPREPQGAYDPARYRLVLRAPRPGEAADPADSSLILDPEPLVRALVDDVAAGTEPALVARRFHEGFSASVAATAAMAADTAGTGTVALAGGVFCNRIVLETVGLALTDAGLRVLVPDVLPFNDGGVAYGQAVVARARLARAAEQPERN